MRRAVFIFLCFAGISGLFPFAMAQEGKSLSIETFQSDIVVERDGSITVSERIVALFDGPDWHGIFRDMPHTYQDTNGEKVYTEVSVLGVTGADGTAIPHTVTKNSANLRIKIGEAGRTVSGRQTYDIRYRVLGALRSFAGYDELYWNATGNDWEIPIAVATARVKLPEDGIIQISCYAGPRGSTRICQDKEQVSDGASFTERSLSPGEGLTVAVGYRSGMVPIARIQAPSVTGAVVVFSLTILAGLAGVMILYWRKGRDFWYARKSLHDPDVLQVRMPLFAHETIVAEYESPDGLRPAEVDFVLRENISTLGVSATIVDLAIRGYIRITEIPKSGFFGKTDYELKKIKEPSDDLAPYEKTLMQALFGGLADDTNLRAAISAMKKFGVLQSLLSLAEKTDEHTDTVSLSALRNKFYRKLELVKKVFLADMEARAFFVQHSRIWRGAMIAVWTVFMSAGIGATIAGKFDFTRPFLGMSAGLAVISFAGLVASVRSMYQRTALGREMFRKIRGYRDFVEHVEKYRQQFFEKENTYMAVLPYAMVFKATGKLADAMKVMGYQPPQPVWYVGAGPFNMSEFNSSMNNFTSALSTNMASAPGGSGSGGGGFSGGGGGGGGGGGW